LTFFLIGQIGIRGRTNNRNSILIPFHPELKLFFEYLRQVGSYGQPIVHIFVLFAAAYITVLAIATAAQIGVDRIIVQKPIIPFFVFVQNGFHLFFKRHAIKVKRIAEWAFNRRCE
jgi:hypothetical protein